MMHRSPRKDLATNLVFISGWVGVLIAVIAVGTMNLHLFILSQFFGTLTAFLYNRWLMSRNSWDNTLSLILSIAALIVRSEWLMYGSTIVRSVSYQLVFYRLVNQRAKQDLN